MNNSGERPCDLCSIDGLIISIIGTIINPAKRDSPGDHLLVNGCMRTSKMGGSNDSSGQMQ